jgi:hypothetical protein
MLTNIINSWKHIPYTWYHYLAFLDTEKKLLGYYKYKFHDLDKILMYIFLPFLGTKRIKKIHKKFNKHHIIDYKNQNECNYEEAIIDWECARFTKPDKQETARVNAEQSKFKNGKHYPFLLEELDKLNL